MDLAAARHARAPVVAALRRFPGTVTCCFCRAGVREAELVRPLWGPRPCPAGHRHHLLEVVARCRSCRDADEERTLAYARAVAALQEGLEPAADLVGASSAAGRP